MPINLHPQFISHRISYWESILLRNKDFSDSLVVSYQTFLGTILAIFEWMWWRFNFYHLSFCDQKRTRIKCLAYHHNLEFPIWMIFVGNSSKAKHKELKMIMQQNGSIQFSLPIYTQRLSSLQTFICLQSSTMEEPYLQFFRDRELQEETPLNYTYRLKCSQWHDCSSIIMLCNTCLAADLTLIFLSSFYLQHKIQTVIDILSNHRFLWIIITYLC